MLDLSGNSISQCRDDLPGWLIACSCVCFVVTAIAILSSVNNQARAPRSWLITWVSYSVASVALAGVSAWLKPSIPSELLDAMAYNAMVHVVCMAVFIWKRHRAGGQPQIDHPAQAPLVDGPVHTIVSAELTCCEKCWVYTVGWCINKLELIMWVLSAFGIDLSAFFFPSPFYHFWHAKRITRHYRIFRVHGLQLHADHADAYFLFLQEKMLNFVTLTLYKKCVGETYPKWLDSKLQWEGVPPAGFNNHFRIFYNNGTLCQRLSYYLQATILSLFSWLPGFHAFFLHWHHGQMVNRMVIGGARAEYVADFCAFLGAYCGSCCGCWLCSHQLLVFVDNHIQLHPTGLVADAGERDMGPLGRLAGASHEGGGGSGGGGGRGGGQQHGMETRVCRVHREVSLESP